MSETQYRVHEIEKGLDYVRQAKLFILSNATERWKAQEQWVKAGAPNLGYMCENFGELEIPIVRMSRENKSTYDSLEHHTLRFREFAEKWQEKTELIYLKDWHFCKTAAEYYEVPECFQQDWLNAWYDEKNKMQPADAWDDYRFVYMGTKGTWTPMHHDVLYSNSWSANLCGRKLWILYPPEDEYKLQDLSKRTIINDVTSPIDLKKFPNYDNQNEIRIIQQPGEAIFIPSGWYHQVHNLDDAISINHNWFNSSNASDVLKFLLSELKAVEKEIDHCRESLEEDGMWNSHCQLILHSNAGMNLVEFTKLLLFQLSREPDQEDKNQLHELLRVLSKIPAIEDKVRIPSIYKRLQASPSPPPESPALEKTTAPKAPTRPSSPPKSRKTNQYRLARQAPHSPPKDLKGPTDLDQNAFMKLDSSKLPLEMFDIEAEDKAALKRLIDPETPTLAQCPLFLNNKWVWEECRVLAYDEDKDRFRVEFVNHQAEKLIRRINVIFSSDSMDKQLARRNNCFEDREKMKSILRYHYFISKQNLKVRGLQKPSKQRILQLAIPARFAKDPTMLLNAHEAIIKTLFDQVEAEYLESNKRAIVDYHLLHSSAPMMRQLDSLRIAFPSKATTDTNAKEEKKSEQDSEAYLTVPQVIAHFTQTDTNLDVLGPVLHIFQAMKTIESEILHQHSFVIDLELDSHLHFQSKFPCQILEFEQLQQRHRKNLQVVLFDQWRQSIIFSIQNGLKDYINFFVINLDFQNWDFIHRLMRKVNYLMKAHLSDLIMSSLAQWDDFTQGSPKCLFKIKLQLNASTQMIQFNPKIPQIQFAINQSFDLISRVCKTLLEIDDDLFPLVDTPYKVKPLVDLNQSHANCFDASISSAILSTKTRVHHFIQEHLNQAHKLIQKYQHSLEYVDKLNCRQHQEKVLAIEIRGESLHADNFPAIDDMIHSTVLALEQLIQAKDEIQVLTYDIEPYGVFEITTTQVKQTLHTQCQHQIHELSQVLIDFIRKCFAQLLANYEQLQAHLSMAPTDEKTLESLQCFLDDLDQVLDQKRQVIAHLSHHLARIESLIQQPLELTLIKLIWANRQFPTVIQEIAKKAQVSCQSAREQLIDILVKQRADFQSKLFNVRHRITSYMKLEDFDEYEKNADEGTYLNEQIEQIADTIHDFNFRERVFGFQVQTYELIETMMEEFQPYFRLWSLISEFLQMRYSWLNSSFANLSPQDIHDKMQFWKKDLQAIQDHLQSHQAIQPVVAQIQTNLEDFLPFVEIIQLLAAKVVADQHWEKLLQRLKIGQASSTITLNHLVAAEIGSEIEFVQQLNFQATKEASLADEFVNLHEEFEDFEFSFEEYGNCFILQDLAGIQQKLQDYQIQLGIICMSSYLTPALECDCERLHGHIQSIHRVMNQWTHIQRNWQKYFYFFTTYEKSISTHASLGQSVHEFQSVDLVYRQMIESVHGNPCFTQILEFPPKLLTAVEKVITKLQRIQHGIEKFAQEKQASCPRLFYLSPESLVEFYCCDASKYLFYIQRMFPSIQELQMNSYFSSRIKAIRSKTHLSLLQLSPEVDFYSSAKTKQLDLPDQWINRFEKAMYSSFAEAILAQVKTFPTSIENREHEFGKWLMQNNDQATLRAIEVHFSRSLQYLLEQYKFSIQEFHQLYEQHQALIEYQIQQILQQVQDATAETHVFLSNLILLFLSFAHTLEQLQVTNLSSGAFLCLERVCTETTHCIQPFGTTSGLVFGNDYVNVTESHLFIADNYSYQTFLHLINTFRHFQGGILYGNQSKTSTVRALAHAAGRHIVELPGTCSFPDLQNIVIASCCTGRYLVWDCDHSAVQLLPIGIHFIHQLLSFLKQQTSKPVDFDIYSRVQFNCHSAFVLTRSCESHPSRMKCDSHHFNPIQLCPPNTRYIVEILFQSFGFMNAQLRASQLIECVNQLENFEIASTQSNRKLRLLKAVLRCSFRILMSEQDNQDEEVQVQAIQQALKVIFRNRIQPEQLALFEDLLASEFQSHIFYHDQTCAPSLEQQLELLIHHFQAIGVYGLVGCGKTSLIKQISSTCLVPVYIDGHEIYDVFGHFGSSLRLAKTGILNALLEQKKEIAEGEGIVLIVFDGEVPVSWVESLITILDYPEYVYSTRIFPHVTNYGSRVRYVFECLDLSHANPSLSTRLGHFHISEMMYNWKSCLNELISGLFEAKDHAFMTQVFDWLIESCFDLCSIHPSSQSAIYISRFAQMFKCQYRHFQSSIREKTGFPKHQVYEAIAIFSCLWTFGFDQQLNPRFQLLFQQLITSRPPERKFESSAYVNPIPIQRTTQCHLANGKWTDAQLNVFDLVYDFEKHEFTCWESYSHQYQHFPISCCEEQIIWTKEMASVVYLLYCQLLYVDRETSSLNFVFGDRFQGKTTVVQAVFELLKKQQQQSTFKLAPCHSTTTKDHLAYLLSSNLFHVEAHTLGMLTRPNRNSRTCHYVVLDDYHLVPETSSCRGSLRQFAKDQMLYRCEDAEGKCIVMDQASSSLASGRVSRMEAYNLRDCQLVLLEHPTNTSKQSPRLLRHCNLFHLTRLTNASIQEIMKQQFSHFNISHEYFDATLAIYDELRTKLNLNFPFKKLYGVQLRKLRRIFHQLSFEADLLKSKNENDTKRFQRFWAHECLREFQDCLVSRSDQKNFQTKILLPICRQYFSRHLVDRLQSGFIRQPILFRPHYKSAGYEEVMRTEVLESRLSMELERSPDADSINPNWKNAHVLHHILRLLRLLASSKPLHCLLYRQDSQAAGLNSAVEVTCRVYNFDLIHLNLSTSGNTVSDQIEHWNSTLKAGVEQALRKNELGKGPRVLIYVENLHTFSPIFLQTIQKTIEYGETPLISCNEYSDVAPNLSEKARAKSTMENERSRRGGIVSSSRLSRISSIESTVATGKNVYEDFLFTPTTIQSLRFCLRMDCYADSMKDIIKAVDCFPFLTRCFHVNNYTRLSSLEIQKLVKNHLQKCPVFFSDPQFQRFSELVGHFQVKLYQHFQMDCPSLIQHLPILHDRFLETLERISTTQYPIYNKILGQFHKVFEYFNDLMKDKFVSYQNLRQDIHRRRNQNNSRLETLDQEKQTLQSQLQDLQRQNAISQKQLQQTSSSLSSATIPLLFEKLTSLREQLVGVLLPLFKTLGTEAQVEYLASQFPDIVPLWEFVVEPNPIDWEYCWKELNVFDWSLDEWDDLPIFAIAQKSAKSVNADLKAWWGDFCPLFNEIRSILHEKEQPSDPLVASYVENQCQYRQLQTQVEDNRAHIFQLYNILDMLSQEVETCEFLSSSLSRDIEILDPQLKTISTLMEHYSFEQPVYTQFEQQYRALTTNFFRNAIFQAFSLTYTNAVHPQLRHPIFQQFRQILLDSQFLSESTSTRPTTKFPVGPFYSNYLKYWQSIGAYPIENWEMVENALGFDSSSAIVCLDPLKLAKCFFDKMFQHLVSVNIIEGEDILHLTQAELELKFSDTSVPAKVKILQLWFDRYNYIIVDEIYDPVSANLVQLVKSVPDLDNSFPSYFPLNFCWKKYLHTQAEGTHVILLHSNGSPHSQTLIYETFPRISTILNFGVAADFQLEFFQNLTRKAFVPQDANAPPRVRLFDNFTIPLQQYQAQLQIVRKRELEKLDLQCRILQELEYIADISIDLPNLAYVCSQMDKISNLFHTKKILEADMTKQSQKLATLLTILKPLELHCHVLHHRLMLFYKFNQYLLDSHARLKCGFAALGFDLFSLYVETILMACNRVDRNGPVNWNSNVLDQLVEKVSNQMLQHYFSRLPQQSHSLIQLCFSFLIFCNDAKQKHIQPLSLDLIVQFFTIDQSDLRNMKSGKPECLSPFQWYKFEQLELTFHILDGICEFIKTYSGMENFLIRIKAIHSTETLHSCCKPFFDQLLKFQELQPDINPQRQLLELSFTCSFYELLVLFCVSDTQTPVVQSVAIEEFQKLGLGRFYEYKIDLLELSSVWTRRKDRALILFDSNPRHSTDMTKWLDQFAQVVGFHSSITILSMTNTQHTQRLQNVVEIALIEGHWICLKDWSGDREQFQTIQQLCCSFDKDQIHKQFRLFLFCSLDHFELFPEYLMNHSFKYLVDQNPKGLVLWRTQLQLFLEHLPTALAAVEAFHCRVGLEFLLHVWVLSLVHVSLVNEMGFFDIPLAALFQHRHSPIEPSHFQSLLILFIQLVRKQAMEPTSSPSKPKTSGTTSSLSLFAQVRESLFQQFYAAGFCDFEFYPLKLYSDYLVLKFHPVFLRHSKTLSHVFEFDSHADAVPLGNTIQHFMNESLAPMLYSISFPEKKVFTFEMFQASPLEGIISRQTKMSKMVLSDAIFQQLKELEDQLPSVQAIPSVEERTPVHTFIIEEMHTRNRQLRFIKSEFQKWKDQLALNLDYSIVQMTQVCNLATDDLVPANWKQKFPSLAITYSELLRRLQMQQSHCCKLLENSENWPQDNSVLTIRISVFTQPLLLLNQIQLSQNLRTPTTAETAYVYELAIVEQQSNVPAPVILDGLVLINAQIVDRILTFKKESQSPIQLQLRLIHKQKQERDYFRLPLRSGEQHLLHLHIPMKHLPPNPLERLYLLLNLQFQC